MNEARFATWNYSYEGPAFHPWGRRLAGVVLILMALVQLVVFRSLIPLVIGLVVLGLIIFSADKRKLYVGPRYLICGNQILYFANITRARIDRGVGTLVLETGSDGNHPKARFVLERERFPTGARKKDKIAKNQAAKFDKVADKLLEKVREAAPGVIISETGGVA